MHHPEVLFLDEPTTGLDPQSRLAVHDIITGLQAAGQTIMLITHDMAEADALADRVAIIDHGRCLPWTPRPGSSGRFAAAQSSRSPPTALARRI